MDELERDIELKFGSDICRWGELQGVEIIYLKLNVLGQRGWPDRMLLWRGKDGSGHLLFIEWKRPGEVPRPLQKHIHKIIQRTGFEVFTYDNVRDALREVKEKVGATI